MTSLQRGLAIAADPSGIQNRTRTDSNSIVTPASPRSFIYGRSRSNTLSTMFCGTGSGVDKMGVCDAKEFHTNCSGPPSP